jgi:hypothetical protein
VPQGTYSEHALHRQAPGSVGRRDIRAQGAGVCQWPLADRPAHAARYMTRSGPSAGEGVAQGGGVADVGLDEGEAGTGRDGLEGGQVTGAGQFVDSADAHRTACNQRVRGLSKLVLPVTRAVGNFCV